MKVPRANEGISGHLNYSVDMVAELKKRLEEMKKIYPIADIEIHLAGLEDERWKKYNGKKV